MNGDDGEPSGEQDVAGVAIRRITRIVITLTDGSKVIARPRLARPTVARRHAWERGLRFFDAFFPGSAAGPRRLVAYDVHGHVLARQPLA